MEAPTPDEEDIPPSQLTHGVRRVINCTRTHWEASFNTFLYINWWTLVLRLFSFWHFLYGTFIVDYNSNHEAFSRLFNLGDFFNVDNHPFVGTGYRIAI